MDYRKSRVSHESRRLRIVLLGILSLGLLSFLIGYWAANYFTGPKGSESLVEGKEDITIPGSIPKKLSADQIIKETGAVEAPKRSVKKSEEEFTFTKTLKKETAPAVDPFENQKPAPSTPPKISKKPEKKKVEKKSKAVKKPVKKKSKKVAVIKPPAGKVFTVQVGSFPTAKDATNLKNRLLKKGYNVSVREATVNGKTWRRVHVGLFQTRAAAQRMADKLKKDKLPTFITSVKR